MHQTLPPKPNLEHLKNQAKDLLKGFRQGEKTVLPALRNLRRFEKLTDEEILSDDLSLTEVQFALAMSYGFKNWKALKTHVLSVNPSELTASIKRDNSGVWIEGMEDINWGGPPERRRNSFITVYTAILNAIGEDITYEELMGMAGTAFKIQIAQPDWCPSAACAECGFDTTKTAVEVTGYPIEWTRTAATEVEKDLIIDEGTIQNVRRKIVESIDRGVPCLFASEESSVIVGYRNNGDTLMLRHYWNLHQSGYTDTQDLPWSAGIVKNKEITPDYHDSVIRSLKLALELANTDKYETYNSGFTAYEKWISDLKTIFNDKNQEIPYPTLLANYYCYVTLIDCRRSASEYLKMAQNTFEADIASHLEKASGLYNDIHKKLFENRDCILFPWLMKEGDSWTDEHRSKEIELLQYAYDQERKALSEIESTLNLME